MSAGFHVAQRLNRQSHDNRVTSHGYATYDTSGAPAARHAPVWLKAYRLQVLGTQALRAPPPANLLEQRQPAGHSLDANGSSANPKDCPRQESLHLWRNVDSYAHWPCEGSLVYLCFSLDIYRQMHIIEHMQKRKDITQRIMELARNSGVVSTREVRSLGIHHEYLRRLCVEGKLIRVGRGLYMLPAGAGRQGHPQGCDLPSVRSAFP
jgi:hypothetical protein